MPESIRPLYDALGAEGYYHQYADAYANPHEPEIRALVLKNLHRIPSEHLLDFSAGSGEVSRALLEAGVQQITGSDPYTQALYTRQTGRPCYNWDFQTVLSWKSTEHQFSSIISSFAMHLCPQEALFPLCWNLLQMAPILIIITPHKRPEIEKMPGFKLIWEDKALTPRGKSVRMKAYGI